MRGGGSKPLLAALALTLLPALPALAYGVNGGPLFTMDRSLENHARWRAVGPLVESQVASNGMSFLAVRPFYSRVDVPTAGRRVTDILWPVGQVRDAGESRTWRILLAYGVDWDMADDDSRSRWRVFPFLYGGRSAKGESYLACFPLGGTMLESFTCDRVNFVLFPVYMRSQVNDLTTTHVLWPVVSWAQSARTSRFRMFPLYGQTTREGRGTRRFVLWPFWTSARFEDPREKGSAFVLFPLYGRVKTNRQTGWMLLPPFIRYSKGERITQIHAPWPLVQISKGEVERLYVFPLWGHKRIGKVESSFYAWPIVQRGRIQRESTDVRRLNVLPFYYSETVRDPAYTNAIGKAQAPVAPAPAAVRERYVKVWPLASYRREGTVTQTRVLALWPLKQTDAVARNLAPLWTLYGRTRQGEVWEEELLWGLWRRRGGAEGAGGHSLFPLYAVEREPAAGRHCWSVLGGLISREREGLDRRMRFLYLIHVERREQQDDAGVAPR